MNRVFKRCGICGRWLVLYLGEWLCPLQSVEAAEAVKR